MSASAASRLGLAQVAVAGILWGTGGLAVQLIRDRVPMSVLTISFWRMGIAAVVLVVAVLVLRKLPELLRLLREQPVTAVAVGVCTGAYQALYFASVVAVGVTVATVVALGLAPLLLTVGESVAARRMPSRSRALVLVAALTGLVLVSLSGGGSSGGAHPVAGVLLALASGATYALATTLGRPLAGVSSPLAMTTVTSSAGALALLPFGLLASGPRVTADPQALLVLGYLGVMTLALAYGLLYAGLRVVSGSAAVLATLLEPVTAALLAAVLLDERLGVWGWVGTALILLAVAGLDGDEVPAGGAPAGPPT